MLALWIVVGLLDLYKQRTPPYFLLLVPFVVPALFMGFNLGVFPWRYSCFGSSSGTPFPHEEPLVIRRFSGGVIALFQCSAPLITWYVFESGFGFHIWGIGKGYVPFDTVTNVKRTMTGCCKVSHRCPEVRSPIIIPRGIVSEAVFERNGTT